MVPTGRLQLCGAGAGLFAWRRRTRPPGWTAAVGTAGVVLGGLVVALVACAVVAALMVVNPSDGQTS